MLNRLLAWWRGRRNFVIMDARDNSVTFSRCLLHKIQSMYGNRSGLSPKVFVFHIPEVKHYGFALDIPFDQPTQLADIQYNSRYKCIGFESLNPTVAKMLYDYDVQKIFTPCRLTVTTQTTPQGRVYFRIERPRNPSCF